MRDLSIPTSDNWKEPSLVSKPHGVENSNRALPTCRETVLPNVMELRQQEKLLYVASFDSASFFPFSSKERFKLVNCCWWRLVLTVSLDFNSHVLLIPPNTEHRLSAKATWSCGQCGWCTWAYLWIFELGIIKIIPFFIPVTIRCKNNFFLYRASKLSHVFALFHLPVIQLAWYPSSSVLNLFNFP